MADTTSPPGGPVADPLLAGREAVVRHDWPEAHRQFAAADAGEALAGPDLEAYALATYFMAEADAGRDLRERAFRWYVAHDQRERAAFVALDVARELGYNGRPALAVAWMRKGERELEGLPESYAHGFLTLLRSEAAGMSGDLDRALLLAEEAIAIGDRARDADLRASARVNLGFLKISSGQTEAGIALMEEASIAAVNEELSPIVSGITCCRMIAACRDLGDYRRATEWIEATESYCRRQAVAGFPGVCRIHRAEVKAVSGAWDAAEQELVRATDEIRGYNSMPTQADGYYALGEVRRRRGDLAGAEDALREAHARGRSPQPSLALVRLAEGRPKVALTAVSTALEEAGGDRWMRSRLLPAQVEIAVAAGDVALARAAADAFGSMVEEYPVPALVAERRVSLARVLLAEGDAATAVHELRSAIRGWREVGAPYEVAQARELLATALQVTGDDDGADLELRAALDEFRRLGAAVAAAAAERELRVATERRSGPAQVRRTFMFTDIVGSTVLAEALGDTAWERLLRWHDDMLRAVIAAHAGEVVNSTGDGFFVAFEASRPAVECAVAIQQSLRDHREQTGFALGVRIGLHAAEASRRGDDYSGVGVHVAARVSALAGGGEILATGEVFDEAADVARTDEREVTVKGVSRPVRVALLDWT